MKFRFVLVLALLGSTPVCSQDGPHTKDSFIPKDWKSIQETFGDLNKDSVNDAAIIIESEVENAEGVKPRSLLVLLKEKKGEFYTLACRADHVILDAQSGGTLGDPLESMEIKKNVLIIKFYGGSREQWSTTHRYRLKDNSYFAVIGATYKVEAENVATTYDYNMLNGNLIITTKDSENKANNKTLTKSIKLMPVSLDDFEPDAIWTIIMSMTAGVKKLKAGVTEVGLGDCYHIFFGEEDFGNAETYLDEVSQKLWDDMTVNGQDDEAIPNPKYKDKKFEITYITKTGLKCEPQGEDVYQIVIGFKLLP